MTDDEKRPVLDTKSGYWAALISSPVIVVYCILGKFDQGLGVWACTCLLILAIRARWELRKHVWFWIAVIAACPLQIPFVMFVPWTDRYMSYALLLPYGLLDIFIMIGLFKLAEKAINRGQNAGVRENLDTPS
jgi:hypothetical protein